ncbi:MAG TPA: alkaline phosphatase family protein [Thermoanaerobaculia bacterium]|nr:alkaline phosphatase family protein [Thermoanaerobaculia bacterium]
MLRPTLLGAAVGGAQGALLYGGAIALLHARLNTIGAADALVLLGWCLLIYGAVAAVATGAAMAVLRLWRRLRAKAMRANDSARRADESGGRTSGDATDARRAAAGVAMGARRGATGEATDSLACARAAVRRDVWLATAAFHFVFWLFTASYGLTYDEAPRWVTSACPMLGYLVLRSLVVLVVVAAAAWVLVAIGDAAARRRRLVALLGALALLLVVAQVGVALTHRAAPREKPPLPATLGAPTGQKVAVVGVDGADWRVALPMVERGELPNLARLMAEGSWGPLESFRDSNSAVIWASIYTGRRAAVHGVLDFYAIRLAGMSGDFFGVYPVHRTFFKELALRLQRFGLARVQPIDRSRVAAPLVWEVAHAARRSVGVVDGYYYSYPAPVLGDPQSFFLGYGSDATWRLAQKERRALRADEAALQAWPAGLLAAEGRFFALPDFQWQGAALLDLLGRYGQPDLVTIYSHEPDAVQHERWRFHEPEKFFGIDPATAAAHDEVASFYRQLDAYLGRLRARLAPNTVLVIVSDHGHSPTIFHSMDTQHRHGPPGILLLHGGPVRAGRLPADAGVLDVYPTLLYLLGIAVPTDADGRVLTAALDPAFVKAHPQTTVSSWDGIPLPRSAAPPDAERRREELEKLYSLGYIR